VNKIGPSEVSNHLHTCDVKCEGRVLAVAENSSPIELTLSKKVMRHVAVDLSRGAALVKLYKTQNVPHRLALRLDPVQLQPGGLYQIAILQYVTGGQPNHTIVYLSSGTPSLEVYPNDASDKDAMGLDSTTGKYSCGIFEVRVLSWPTCSSGLWSPSGKCIALAKKFGPYVT
jgi:hypothetical protein